MNRHEIEERQARHDINKGLRWFFNDVRDPELDFAGLLAIAEEELQKIYDEWMRGPSFEDPA